MLLVLVTSQCEQSWFGFVMMHRYFVSPMMCVEAKLTTARDKRIAEKFRIQHEYTVW
jgi:hypothetical protein